VAVSTYAPPVGARRGRRFDPRVAAAVVLAAALVVLGSWLAADRHPAPSGAEQEATTTLDSFYAAVNRPAPKQAAITRLLASDAVLWTNGDKVVGARRIADRIAGMSGLTITRLAPVTVWGKFATTFVDYSVPAPGIEAQMVEVVQLRHGKIFRVWEFALGVTPPFVNAAGP
jgi:hypothetical protein